MSIVTEITEIQNVPERMERLKPIIAKALKGNRMIDILGMPLEDWLVLRAMLGIGGSDVSTALGINEYKTPYELWKEKVGDTIDAKDNDILWFGREVEDLIAKGYTRVTGREVIEDPYIRIHPKYDNLFVNLDRIIVDNGDGRGPGVLECKSTEYSVYKTWLESIPINYYCQVQHELSITGFKWARLAVLVGRKVKVIPIERDEEYIEKQNLALVGWYNAYVKNMVPPERQAADYAYVDPIAGSVKEANDEIITIIDTLKEKQETEKALKTEIDQLKDKVKEFAGDDEAIGREGEIIATYKMIHKKAYEVKAKSYRELRFKNKKGE